MTMKQDVLYHLALSTHSSALKEMFSDVKVGVDQVSISPTFYEQLLRQNPFAKKLQTQIIST